MRTGRLDVDDDGNLTLVTPLGWLGNASTRLHVPAHLDDEFEVLRLEFEIAAAEAKAERDLAESEYRSMKGF